MGDSFIELRFGQAQDIQREIIPVFAIQSVYVDLITSKDIVFMWETNGKQFKRIEYYENEWQCNRRWVEIRKILGVDHQTTLGKGYPIPMESAEWNILSQETRNEIIKRMTKRYYPPKDKDDES